MSGFYPIPLYRNEKFSAAAALTLHLLLFVLGGAVFSQPAQFGVEAGFGGIEVHLTAAPAFIEAPLPRTEASDAVIVDKNTEAEPEAMPLPKQEAPEVRGDGSSLVPGKDSTTFRSAGGAETLAQPHYLKNPAPRYPEEARRGGQEGLVLLSTRVDSRGLPEGVKVKASSGYPVLDRAALEAVRRWKFRPARVGSVAVDSTVEIPVRFQLDRNAA